MGGPAIMTYTSYFATGTGSVIGFYEKEVHKLFGISITREARKMRNTIKSKMLKPIGLDDLTKTINEKHFEVLKKELQDILDVLIWAGYVKQQANKKYYWVVSGERKEL